MRNPSMADTLEESLRTELALDPDAFPREYLAQFSDSISGFLNSAFLRAAVAPDVYERAYDHKHIYVAALDPAFKGDAFAFTIGHYEPVRGWVQDVIRHFKPADGAPLNPAWVLEQIIPICESYTFLLLIATSTKSPASPSWQWSGDCSWSSSPSRKDRRGRFTGTFSSF
jgi:hypothetical protein